MTAKTLTKVQSFVRAAIACIRTSNSQEMAYAKYFSWEGGVDWRLEEKYICKAFDYAQAKINGTTDKSLIEYLGETVAD